MTKQDIIDEYFIKVITREIREEIKLRTENLKMFQRRDLTTRQQRQVIAAQKRINDLVTKIKILNT